MSELTYESAFPGRFLKAALFEGKHVTLTIEKAFMETLEGERGKENKLILAFEGKTMQLVCNKTNAFCLKEMFTNKVAAWVGKRVVFYPTDTNFGPKKVDCVRIFGSPDIAADVEVTARIGRKNFKATLHKTATKNGTKAATTATLDPRINAAFEILGWDQAQRDEYLRDNAVLGQSEIAVDLNRLVDEAVQ
jgi:hypothetical protein